MWMKIRRKTRSLWTRFKLWAYGLLVAIGFVTITIQAIVTSFTYTRATEYTDNTPMPLSEIQSTQLYCDGSLIVSEPGADEEFDPDMLPGTYDCYETHTDIYGRESVPSTSFTKVVIPLGLPKPPIPD